MAAKKMAKPLTKTELMASISEDTGLTKNQVAAVMDSLQAKIKKSLGRSGCGKFILPGLLKVEKVKVPARPARKGVPNPFKPGIRQFLPHQAPKQPVRVRSPAIKDSHVLIDNLVVQPTSRTQATQAVDVKISWQVRKHVLV